MNHYIMLFPVLIPLIAGTVLGVIRPGSRRGLCLYVFLVLAAALGGTVYICFLPEEELSLGLFTMAEGLSVYFHADSLSKLFSVLMAFVWLMAALSAFEYMEHEKNEKRFFSFYLIVGGILSALGYSGNLLTMYLFYELMTLTSVPLVLHSMSPEAVSAGLKYLFYSIGGAFMVLFGFFLFASGGIDLTFVPGGVLGNTPKTGLVLAAVFLMITGFGTKAGMFPMHGWLPTAHPVAPAPASAVLSGAITKAGVLGILRCVFYIAGADYIRGTWVQYVWITLSLITVLMGSMLAYRENVLKKRLAYSTVSQVSYVLFGLSVLHPVAFVGALLHMVFHSLVKNTLFLSAGAVICKTGRTKVQELRGIGKEMPVTLVCFLTASLTLIGIPPTSAFVSKWYLANGALDAKIPTVSWLGPAILLVSAVLTAGYLLPIAIQGFLPGEDYDYGKLVKREPSWRMLAPVCILAALSVLFGIWPTGLIDLLTGIAATLM